MMDAGTLQGHQARCRAFQQTLADVRAKLEQTGSNPGLSARVDALASALEHLVKGMESMRAARPMMHVLGHGTGVGPMGGRK